MDGENNGNPENKMDDLGGPTPIFGNTHLGGVSHIFLIFIPTWGNDPI